MNYNEKAIKTILGSKKNLKQVIDDVLHNLEYDEDAYFNEVMEQFLWDFNNIAAELVTVKVLGMDMSHHYVMTNQQLTCGDVQDVIDGTIFKDFDIYVNRLFDQINAGDFVLAAKTYNLTFNNKKLDEPKFTEERFNKYLDALDKELKRLHKPFDFANLGKCAENQKLHDQLQADLGVSAQDAATGNAVPSQASGRTKAIKV